MYNKLTHLHCKNDINIVGVDKVSGLLYTIKNIVKTLLCPQEEKCILSIQ